MPRNVTLQRDDIVYKLSMSREMWSDGMAIRGKPRIQRYKRTPLLRYTHFLSCWSFSLICLFCTGKNFKALKYKVTSPTTCYTRKTSTSPYPQIMLIFNVFRKILTAISHHCSVQNWPIDRCDGFCACSTVQTAIWYLLQETGVNR